MKQSRWVEGDRPVGYVVGRRGTTRVEESTLFVPSSGGVKCSVVVIGIGRQLRTCSLPALSSLDRYRQDFALHHGNQQKTRNMAVKDLPKKLSRKATTNYPQQSRHEYVADDGRKYPVSRRSGVLISIDDGDLGGRGATQSTTRTSAEFE